jgi:hypothetical protein
MLGTEPLASKRDTPGHGAAMSSMFVCGTNAREPHDKEAQFAQGTGAP